MGANYAVFKGQDNQFYWHLEAGNYKIILQSEGYSSKQAALNGIQSVRDNSPNDEQYERKIAKNGEPYFVLKAINGEPIGKGETYSSNQMMERGVESVKKNGPTQTVDDQTKGKPPKCKVIFVNNKKFTVCKPSLTGTEILDLVGYTPNKYDLSLKNGSENIPIGPDESVKLKNGMHFRAILKQIIFG